MAKARLRSFEEFWPFYLGQHRKPITRALHLLGTSAALALAVAALSTKRPGLLLAALGVAYGLAWVAHFFVERNRPATFTYPLWSFAADWKMWWLALSGRLRRELRRHGIAV